MDTAQLIAQLRMHADAVAARPMRAYMRDRFEFLGIARPALTALIRPYLRATAGWEPGRVVASSVQLWAQPEREFIYTAVALLERHMRRFAADDVADVLPLIDQQAWWDSVDGVRKPISQWALHHPLPRSQVAATLESGSMWQRRVAITLQLQWKGETDTALLSGVLVHNLGDREFFIQKAIGWALRDYSKTDPGWVAAFLRTHHVEGLALREASKYLPAAG